MPVSLATIGARPVWFLSPVVHHPLCVLKHLLFPQLEKVSGICIELQSVLSVLSVDVQFIERRRFVAGLVRLQHCRRHRVP